VRLWDLISKISAEILTMLQVKHIKIDPPLKAVCGAAWRAAPGRHEEPVLGKKKTA
jgi:hypothetical protein